MRELLNRFASGCRSHRTTRLAVTTGVAGLLLVGFSTSGFASANLPPVVYYACVNHTTHAFQYSTATATCSAGFVKENWNQTGPAGPKGATGAPGPQGPSGFSQIQHGGTGGSANNPGSFGFVVAPVTVTITPTTEAAITSTASIGSRDGTSASSDFSVCSEKSGSTTLTELTDETFVASTAGVMPATLSVALIPNGTYAVGLCSENDSGNATWLAGSTTVVIGNYVAPGLGAAKVQPPVLTNAKSAKKL